VNSETLNSETLNSETLNSETLHCWIPQTSHGLLLAFEIDNRMNDPSTGGTRPITGSVNLTGRRLGDAQILKRLGRGGMADVYVANQVTLGRRVALKVLRPDLAKDANYVERFRREARAAARLTHPNIVQVYEVGCTDSMHYISQEYVDGLNLRQQLDRSGPLSPDQAVVVLQSVADALAAASAQGVTHRDIKPENIMVNQRGEIKVADFGLARVTQGEHQNELTQIGMTMGTPLYMSPEQVQGQPADVRSDLYSLGVTMYHLLVGRPPFEADSPLALAVKHLHEDPQRISEARPIRDLPPWLCEAIERLMEKSPAKRFQTPEALSQFIHQSVSHTTGIATGAASATLATRIDATRTLQQLIGPQSKRSSTAVLLAKLAMVVLPLLALGAGVWWSRQQPRMVLTEMLQPGSMEVPVKESVAAQYLEAVRLNEPEGWLKVIEEFPPADSPVNLAYAIKAKIQLARLYRDREDFRASGAVINELLQEASVSSFYRAVALAELFQTQQREKNTAGMAATRRDLRQAYQSLQSTPDKQKIFENVVPKEIVDDLRVTTPKTS
jgi:serine/threonine-protein kinase